MIPDSTTSSNPAQYRRIQDFYISSDISLDCVSSSSNIRTQWIIRNCTPQSSNTIQFTSSQIQTNFSELYVPARTLDYGIYELKLIVTTATYPQLTTSASAYVQINPSGITANMVPLGTSIITSGQSKDLLLDPGSYSVDPDAQIFNASVSDINEKRTECFMKVFVLYNIAAVDLSVLLSTIRSVPTDSNDSLTIY